jgi:DNA invertase Pin-like site-specific DNA recombinase
VLVVLSFLFFPPQQPKTSLDFLSAVVHFLRVRLRGGLLNKARRGELALSLPVEFVYDEQGRVRFDPDSQVRESIRLFFEVFRRTRSAYATARHLPEQGLLFPRRLRTGPNKGALVWAELCHLRGIGASP